MIREQIRIAQGQPVFSQGESGDCAYLIDMGRIEIVYAEESGRERRIAMLGVHDIFGELALLGENKRSASARAATDVCLTVLSLEFFSECLQKTEPITRHLLRTVTARLQHELRVPVPVETSLQADVDQARALMQIQLTQGLTRALEQRELDAALQPIVALADESIVGFEALARWQSPQYGAVPPSRFVPLAEQSGLIREFGRYVIRQAMANVMPLSAVVEGLYLSINISVRQFSDPELFPTLAKSLETSRLKPAQIKLEITESVLMQDLAAAHEFFAASRALGVGVMIDDFGTGYSALSQLHRFDIDAVKLDRSFIAGVSQDRKVESVVRAVGLLCRELGITTVAEGVETREQADACRALGIDNAQGFLYSPALLREAAEGWLQQHQALRNRV
jgi:EAL domain-containing protein (putative c-di-GMP-specific phosphodiesterase class I)